MSDERTPVEQLTKAVHETGRRFIEDQVEKLIQFHNDNGIPDRIVIRHSYGSYRVEVFGSDSPAMSTEYSPQPAKTMREAVENAIKVIEMAGYVEACKTAIEKSKRYHGRD